VTACDRCDNEARYLVYAAYPVGTPDDVHPRMARFPAPMIRACGPHLDAHLDADAQAPLSTYAWVVVAIRQAE